MPKRLLRLLLLLLASTLTVFATPISFVVAATGTGSLNGVAFTNAAITITASGNTTNVQDGGGGFFTIDPIPAILSIAGFGPTTFSGGAQVYVDQSFNTAGVATSGVLGAIFLQVTDASLSTYTLNSSTGPLSSAPTGSFGFTFSTPAGNLIVSSVTGNGTFQATLDSSTPEPATLSFVALGLAALLRRHSQRLA